VVPPQLLEMTKRHMEFPDPSQENQNSNPAAAEEYQTKPNYQWPPIISAKTEDALKAEFESNEKVHFNCKRSLQFITSLAGRELQFYRSVCNFEI
jgi:hypothetical protein